MLQNFKRFLSLAAVSLSLSSVGELAAGHGKGLIPMSPEQVKRMETTWPRIITVKPNKFGANRIQEHHRNNGLDVPKLNAAPLLQEFETVVGLKYANRTFGTLPSSVNNTTLPSFPPIGDQQEEGSCVAWGSTYYQASHELGLLNGNNNKTSFNNVLSPRWTYNLLNGGADGGLVPDTAFSLLAQNGAPSIVAFPYINGDVTSWDLEVGDWIAAIGNRFAPAHYVTGIGGANQDLCVIKQLLINGHVLTFATFIDSWVFTQVLQDPSNPNSPYVGQQAVTYMNGQNGGHFMTIVGYDDNIWIDVNGSGQVDQGERGAFLVANSWGSFWGNQGLIWVSYDAFRNQSSVAGGPSVNRVALASAGNNYVFSVVPKALHYSPTLIAQFSLTQNYRDQIAIKAGVSAPSQMTPTTTFDCYALMNQGGGLEFDGTQPGNRETATFAVDMTDLLVKDGSTQNYYLVAADNAAGNPTTLSSFLLLDLVNDTTTPYNGNPLEFDNSQVAPYIAYAYPNTGETVPTVSIDSPARNAVISGIAMIDVTATDPAGINTVSLSVDDALQQELINAPYQFALDTTKLRGGTHQITVRATNNNGISATQSIPVMVDLFMQRVNCGGQTISAGGVTYMADSDYTLPSATYTNASLPASIYSTERFGSNFSYHFPVPNGTYSVQLLFEEIYFRAAGKRVFNVSLNDNLVLTNLDLFHTKGFASPYTPTFPVTVTNGQIHVHFTSTVNNATISAIQIIQTQ